MVLYLMASHGYPPGLVLHPKPGSFRVAKDYLPLLHSPGPRHNMKRLDAFNVKHLKSGEKWKPVNEFSEIDQFVTVDSTTSRPVLIDVQESHPNSILFSFGIAEQCTRHEKILQFLMSSEAGGSGLDLSVISDLMGLQALRIHDICQKPFPPGCTCSTLDAVDQPFLLYPRSEICAPRPLLQHVRDLTHRSDCQIPITCVSNDFKDLVSVLSEYYLLKNSVKWRKQSVLIPHFNRLDFTEARATVYESSMMPETVKFAPLKSPDKIKLKPSPKKKTGKRTGDRDLYRKNYFHACESLLSIIVDKKRNGKTAILSLKKSGPELPQLLTQFSASIAGTGLAVLFSVVCHAAYSRVPFCGSKLFNTGIGFGLIWISWAVNRLRDTVIYVTKSSGKVNLKEDEMLKMLDRRVNEIFFRAATLMAVAVLRFV
ncbi:hypothetical protein NMG60_11034884 [Bertholletia excelsa]